MDQELTVMVVEDFEPTRRLLVGLCTQSGLNAVSVGSVAEVVPTALRTNPSLILLDLQLPDGNGLDVMKELRRRLSTAWIPVVAFSGSNPDLLDSTARKAGCVDALKKPFSLYELALCLGRWLRPRDEVFSVGSEGGSEGL